MPSSSHITRVAFSVTNSICYDQRVMKMAETVTGLNCDVTIIGRIIDNCSDPCSVPFRTKRFKMYFKRGYLFYKFFNIRLLFYLFFHKYDLLVSNDLDTLLPNFLVSKLKRLPLIFDSHEYFTGLPEIQNRPLVKWIWTSIEKLIFPHLKYVITVSEPIASLYEKIYFIRPLVVRNFSKNADQITPYTRKELGISENDLILIIQGTGINIDKGAEELIDAVKISDAVSLLVAGAGDVVKGLKLKVSELDLGHRIIFIPSVRWEMLMKYTRSADIGMCLEKDTNLNYRFSLPNKLFDYIAAGIPVIASDLPETRKIIIENRCGMIINRVSPVEIADAILTLKNNPDKLAELKRNAVLAAQSLNWDIEREKVVELYKGIMGQQ